MAGWQTLDLSNDCFRVTVTSRSWWRWRWAKLRHIPYFVGDHPRFAFEVEVLKDPQENKAYWALHAGTDEVKKGYLVGLGARFSLVAPGKASGDIMMPMLSTSGEYQIVLGQGPSFPNDGVGVAYSFSVVTREGFIVKFLAPMVFGIGSLTLGALNWLS